MLSTDESSLPGGGKASQPPAYTTSTTIPSNSEPRFQTRFACLSLHMSDRIRFLRFPQDVVKTCQQTIASTWRRGIQSQRPYGGSFEFKLDGNPWDGNHDQVEARRMIYALFRTLHSLGWVLTLNTDISKKNADKDSLLFRHQTPPPAECDWACISFSRYDRIRFIDMPPNISVDVAAKLSPGQVQARSVYKPNVNEIKLSGSPWFADGTETMKARELLLILLETLEEEGWTVYASIDQQNSGKKLSNTDTWYCCKPKGWVKGAPVYHS